jgi:hypothetical protein
MLPYNRTSIVIILTILVSGMVYFIPEISNPYLNILLKGSIITFLFGVSTVKFKLAEEITCKVGFLNRMNS